MADKTGTSADSTWLALGIAVGIAIGAGIGVAMDNLALGVGIGIAIGVAIGLAFRETRAQQRKRRNGDEPPAT